MPAALDHLEMANRNHEVFTHLLTDVPKFAPWIATIAFYKALHIIEAVFENDPTIGHTTDHDKRARELKKHKRFERLHIHYSALQRASSIARYATLKEFADQFPGNDVVSELIEKRLFEVEKSAALLLKKDAGKLIRVKLPVLP